MWLIYADISLMNSNDFINAKQGIIPNDKVRMKDVRALVDTGAYMMTINGELRDELGLPFDKHVDVELV